MSALNRIPLRESGQPLVDLRRHCPSVRVSRNCIPFLRETVADMLNRAQDALPGKLRFWVRTALRTIEMQREGYEGFLQSLQWQHPEWSYATLRRMTNRYFAPVDQKAPPGHCTGGAVDLWIVTPGGKPLDLVSPYEHFWDGSETFIEGLTPTAERNRMLLYETMIGAGFSNCEDEYWHYSYGDAAWAVRTGAEYCVYGLVEAPVGWPRESLINRIRAYRASRE